MTSIQNRAANIVGVAAVLLASVGLTGAAQARDNVQFSVQIGSPGYSPVYSPGYGYPVYSQPQVVYSQPQVVYVQPRPVYIQPAPVYYQGPPVYVAPQVVQYGYPGLYPNGRPHGYYNGHGRGHDKHGWKHNRGGQYVQPQNGYGQVYYQR